MPTATSREITTLRRLHDLMRQVNARHDLQEVLQAIAEGVADVVGFKVAAIRQLRNDGTLECVAVAGDDEARAMLLGHRRPVEEMLAEFAVADEWGSLRFVPHGRIDSALEVGWIPDVEPLDVPDAWHPEDALFAPLLGPTGELAGVLAVDLPYDGRRPSDFQREVLEMYAVQAGIAINNAAQRSRLAEEVRLASTVRTIMDTAGRGLDLGRVIDDSVQPVVEGLRCHGMWIRAFEGQGERPGRGRGAIHPTGTKLVSPDALIALAHRVATQCWDEQRPVIVTDTQSPDESLLTTDELDLLFQTVGQIGSHSLLLIPLGAGRECLGYMALTQTEEASTWSDAEIDAAMEIGRDLGRAVLHARLFERERELVAELQDLDRYKTELIATVSHELRNPLTSIVGHLELLQGLDVASDAERSMTALVRNTERLESLVEDLLLLSKVGDPNRPLIPSQVNLGAIARETVDLFCLQARQRGVALTLVDGDGPALAWGDSAELDRAVCNIVGNAVKYSPDGGDIAVSLHTTGDRVVVECCDEGIGISVEDQQRLFTEFFRSSNPEATALPGTGLGLTIVKRIVDRHGGSIEVASELGKGSTFTVTLPAAR